MIAPSIFPAPLCVVDTETWHPGGKGHRHRLVEVAAVVLDVRGYPGAVFAELCRPADLPRHVRQLQGNAVNAAELWAPAIRPEADVVRAFAEWHFNQGAPPLIAYNAPFDRSAICRALADADGFDPERIDKDWPLPWGECLMQFAKRILGCQSSKEAAAMEALPDPRAALAWMARQIRYTGPLDMHRGLPDALLEGALLVALRRRELRGDIRPPVPRGARRPAHAGASS